MHILVELIDRFIEELYDDLSTEGITALQYWSPNISDIGPSNTSFRTSKSIAIQGAWRNYGRSLSPIVSPLNSSLRGVGTYIESLYIYWDHITGRVDPASFLIYKNVVAVLRELHGESYAVQHLAINVEFGTIPSWTEIAPEFRKIYELLRLDLACQQI